MIAQVGGDTSTATGQGAMDLILVVGMYDPLEDIPEPAPWELPVLYPRRPRNGPVQLHQEDGAMPWLVFRHQAARQSRLS